MVQRAENFQSSSGSYIDRSGVSNCKMSVPKLWVVLVLGVVASVSIFYRPSAWFSMPKRIVVLGLVQSFPDEVSCF
jgi:hypothetical protein